MKRVHVMMLSGAVLASSAAMAQETPPAEQAQEEKKAPQVYDEQADAREQIAAALERAKKDNTRVLIQWGGNWCGWCIMLDRLMREDAEIARKVLYEYEVVHVDTGRGGKNVDLANSYGAAVQKHGYPFLTILDAEGAPVINQETVYFENEDQKASPGHNQERLLAFLTEHQAAPLYAEEALKEGLAEAEKSGRILFLHFGAPWCGWCHRLEGWMAQEEVAEILAKRFVDVKIDTDRMIGGRDILAKYNEEQSGGIPWFAAVKADGKAITTSAGAGGSGNIGCPWTDEEVRRFGVFLEESGGLDTDEIAQLLESLKAYRQRLEKKE
jgi:thiol-disulfide isomerase/thioredoxin